MNSTNGSSSCQSTLRSRQLILDRMCRKHGTKPFAALDAKNVKRFRDEIAETPEAANELVKSLRQLYRFAVDYEYIDRNPALAVEYRRNNSEGHHSWTESEIAKCESTHPIGTPGRLALALLLYTAQRRSDVIRLGPSHTINGNLVFTQHKNRDRQPIKLTLPITDELKHVLDRSALGTKTFLETTFGNPCTDNGFGNWFKKRCREAGLPDRCTSHGLRKAASSRFAESGFTEQEIMAWTGHWTSKEVTRYVRAANQSRIAANSVRKISAIKSPTSTSTEE